MVLLLMQGGGVALDSTEGLCPTSGQLALEAIRSEMPPLGVAITGHGAEHCIRAGEHWLTTDARISPSAQVLLPHELRSPAVLLNGCSSLRLGDSVVPRRYSVAAALHAAGAAVIGAYRNLHTSPDVSEDFSDALLEGLPLGRIVNRLNLRLRERGESRGSFQLLGDAARVVSPPRRSPRRRPEPPEVMNEPADLLHEVNWVEHLYSTFARCVDLSEGLRASYRHFLEAARLAVRGHQTSSLAKLTAEEHSLLRSALETAVGPLLRALLDEFFLHISRGRWLEGLYAPFSHRTEVEAPACPRCTAKATRHRYHPFGQSVMWIERDECDACGTLSEHFGSRAELAPLMAWSTGRQLRVQLPPLERSCQGRIFIHRASVRPLEWPPGGGELGFDLEELPFRGRITVVGAVIGPGTLALNYQTLFTPPAAGASP
jgi:hypothetical protein